MIAVGIDTGGTCTDAVIYDTAEKHVLAAGKASTTHEALEKGIRAALMTLPQDLLRQAEFLSLSTTLATNACVENKGGRACLILIGTSRKLVESVYASYGFESMDSIFFLSGDAKKGQEPDWSELEALLPRLLAEYESIAVSQMAAYENHGAFEQECRRRIRAHSSIPVVCGYEIFQDLNMLKRGAGALLNARLLPVMEGFFAAVHAVLEELSLHIPVVIMRSDGSLVSEEYSRSFPIETLLCGPTASTKGGLELSDACDALIIDMGGTTTDIAVVRNGEPEIDSSGIRVAGWRTLVHGIEITTASLGGDTRVVSHEGQIELGDRRVIPISQLADWFPQVEAELREIAEARISSGVPLWEFLQLMKPIENQKGRYTDREQKLCALLADGPKSVRMLADQLGIDLYFLDTARLEDEGVVLRSGLTPTDAMVLEGSLKLGSEAAARTAVRILDRTIGHPSDYVRTVVTLVENRLYRLLTRVLWLQSHPEAEGSLPADIDSFTLDALKQYRNRGKAGFLTTQLHTDAMLVGVGAPTWRFLPEIADALHTQYLIPDHAGVCNALGAMLGDVRARQTVEIRIDSVMSEWGLDHVVYTAFGRQRRDFESLEGAISFAKTEAAEMASEKALRCGARTLSRPEVNVEKRMGTTELGEILRSVAVTAEVRGSLQAD